MFSDRHVLLWAVLEGPRGTQSKQVLTNQVTDGFQQLPRQVHLPRTRGNNKELFTCGHHLLFPISSASLPAKPIPNIPFSSIFLSFVPSSSSTAITYPDPSTSFPMFYKFNENFQTFRSDGSILRTRNPWEISYYPAEA